MKNNTPTFRSSVVAVLVLSLLFSFVAPRAVANNNSQISVQIGQPNIWSLGQAHYLLSAMRDRSRGIGVQVPIPENLDPNSANGARLDVLRTLFSAGAEVNTATSTQNRLNRQKFDAEFARYQAAQSRIDEILTPYTQAVSEVSSLKIQLDALPADEANKEARKKLTEQIAQRTAERDALKAELDELRRTQAATALQLTSTSPPGAITPNTPPDDLASIFQAIVKGGGTAVPKLNASTVLDNYILMQYEVIAKQLTLLRDEVGPGQRLIFLELPMSVYSVPKRDDEYVVQTQWNVKRFLGLSAAHSEQPSPQHYGDEGFVGEPISINMERTDIRDVLDYITEQVGINFIIDESIPAMPIRARFQDVPWNEALDSILAANDLGIQVRGSILRVATRQTLAREGVDDNCADSQPVPITLDLVNDPERIRLARAEDPCQSDDLERLAWMDADPTRFHVVDIIPRQSALNVNDVHGTQSGFALTAKFLSLAGFGGQVGYQRQRSIYEQFLQQEVYASAFGKGLSNFGWTFGPLPGTKRLAPGVRTTYAILAIPKDALGVELSASAKVYKRDRSPDDNRVVKPLPQNGSSQATFKILVPNERTEGFWVNRVFYTPVEKGKHVTVVMQGDYFSPLTGILVNGIPLTRTVSIGRNELPPPSSNGNNPPAATGTSNNSEPKGEFEHLNPQQLILSFNMGSSYVGTPLITLVTPEKTSVINYYRLRKINTHERTSLFRLSRSEPMFRDTFSLTSAELVDGSNPTHITINLRGAGLQPGAEIFIGPRPLSRHRREQADFITSGTYRVRFERPTDNSPVTITYRHTTTQTTQEASVSFQQTVTSNYQIVRYQPATRRRPPVLDVVLSLSGNAGAPHVVVDPRDGNQIGSVISLGGGRYSLQIEALRDPVAISVTAGGLTTLFDIGIPLAPSIDTVVNTATRKPEGPGGKPAVVILRGTNFRHVRRVLFGTKEASIMQIDPQVMLVTAPAADEGVVQVLLETNINLRGRIVSNVADFRTQGKATYTYTK